MEDREEKRPIKVAFVGMGKVAVTAALDLMYSKPQDVPDVIVAVDESKLKTGVSLQRFAESLVEMGLKEAQDLVVVLKEEYGIEASSATLTLTENERSIQQACLSLQKKAKKDYYVPKKLGIVYGKPKGKYRK